MIKKTVNLLFLYITGSVFLVLYSYTQVDLGLTLTDAGPLQTIQKYFQYIGFFQRPLSALFYLVLMTYFFILYRHSIALAERNLLPRSDAWTVILGTACSLVFAYPAFSHDLFNHMFTAKTILFYKINPYTATPMEFTSVDPWLGFMHWTHVVSIYQPLWIAITLIPYLLGFGYFLLTLYNFKLILAVFYLMASYFIEKSLSVVDKNRTVSGLIIFSLNPLILVESLVSAHNDIAMIAFIAAAYFCTLQKEKIISLLMISVSIALKPVSLFWLPLYLFAWKRNLIIYFAILAVGAIYFFAMLTGRDLQPWYFMSVILGIALSPKSVNAITLTVALSLGMLLQYLPFLYTGSWSQPVPFFKLWVTILPVFFSLLYIASRLLFKKITRMN